jgi:DNA-directed RNA polymerase subunit RPC12/RpoP
MSQRILNMRVRPARAAILINRKGDEKDLLLAFEFFSKIWGGRFGQILPVDAESCDDLTRFRLGASRPEFVYGIGLDDKHWATAVRQASQPRSYRSLRPEFVRGLKQYHPEDYYLVDHALVHLFQTRNQGRGHKRTLRLVTPDESSPMLGYCAAMFGIHHQDLSKEYFDANRPFSETKATAFGDLAIEFVKGCYQSWLDVTGYKLNPHIAGQGGGLFEPSPTVVLVQDRILDLPLFWNLRTASDTTHPAWIIPIPSDGATEAPILNTLKEWLLGFLPYGSRPNYCNVTSQSVPEAVCRGFAEQFQAALTGTPVETVDYEPPGNRLPVVVPYEYVTTWPVDLAGRKLTLQPPRPRAFADLGPPRGWIVDLLSDVKTGRAVKGLQLPPSPVVFELLNGPCPPTLQRAAIPRTGDGADSINLLCSHSREVINSYLPTSEEVFGEILREYGIEPRADEKRSSYLPVIKRFGGLYSACKAFSGQSQEILTTLADKTKTVEEIRGECKLGKGEFTGDSYSKQIEGILGQETERMKRVSRQRFREYARHSAPESVRLQSLLEYWADRTILERHWRVGPCGRCNQRYFVPRLDIQRRIVCTNCGHRITLPATVAVGYTLQRAVKHAIREGIVPVALTGRFLCNMTNHGFFWLPGIKYRTDTKEGDIDVVACCDGHLVFCECKGLKNTPSEAKVWNDVVSQFLETAEVARRCGGHLVVLAAQVSKYPQDVRDRIAASIGVSIPHLLLDNEDLEIGHRDVQDDKLHRWLRLYDVLPVAFPERPREPTDKPRTIKTGWGLMTR